MTRWIHRSLGIGVLLTVMAALGCGGGGGPKGDKIIVKGKVTVDGKDADGITISFYGPQDKAASGIVTTQADGTYEVMFMSAAGEGNYKITANKVAGKAGMQSGDGIDEYQMKLASGAGGNQLPVRYNDPDRSGLTAALTKGVNEGKNFALKSK